MFILFAFCTGPQCSSNLTMTQIGPFRTAQACQTARDDAARTRNGSGLERFADECLSLKTGQVAR